MTTRQFTADVKIAIGILVFSLINYIILIPQYVIKCSTSPIYPYIVNTLILFSGIGYLFESLGRRDKTKSEEVVNQEDRPVVDHQKRYSTARVFFVILTTGVWIWSMEFVGFLLSAFIFLPAVSLLYGSRKKKRIMVVTVVLPIILYSVFRLLNTSLPEGPLEDILNRMLFSK